METLYSLLPMIVIIGAMYMLLIRPQRKREKAVNEMRSGLRVGDEVVTIGGICGKIVKVKDESIVLQVGAEKVKFEMMKWSVSKVVNESSAPKASKAVEEEEEAPKKALPKKMKKAEASEETVSLVKDETAVEVPIEEVVNAPVEDTPVAPESSIAGDMASDTSVDSGSDD